MQKSKQLRQEKNLKKEYSPISYFPVKVSSKIMCNKCSEFSGWDSKDLTMVRGNKNLACKNCGKICINIISNTEFSITI